MFTNVWFWFAAIVAFVVIALLTRKRKKGRGSQKTIPVVTLNGTIRYGGKGSPIEAFEAHLRGLRTSKPPAVIVRINSPGGTVGASQAIHRTLMLLRSQGIKVVALLEDVAASGGLYIAMGADHVVSHPGTVTGSIGVIMQGYEISEILKRFQINVETIRSGKFKDTGSMSRKMEPEERELLQGLIDDTYGQFVAAVAEARKLTVDEVKAFADGRVMTGRQALNVGLVDELGGLEDATAAAERLAGIPQGQAVLKNVEIKDPLLKRLGLSFSNRTLLEEVLPEASLSGLPLWLMPRSWP